MGKADSGNSRWGWIVAGAVALFLLAFLRLALSHGPRLPVFQGKDLYTWATELRLAQQNYSDPDRWKKVETATAAIRAMGTNALPFVMEDIRAQNTEVDRAIAWLAVKAPFLKLKPANVADRWVRGTQALEALGPLAKPCLPELVNLASKNTGYIESALVAVGPDALPAFTNLLATSTFPRTGNLIGALANAVYANRIKPEQAAGALPYIIRVFRSTDSHGRWYAASALGAIQHDPEICVPLLINGLTDSAPAVRESCIESLGRFGEAGSAYAAKLADMFEQTDAQTRRAICGTLASFHSAAAIAVPILVRALRDPDENVRIWAAMGLGRLASLPEQTVPALVETAQDQVPMVRVVALESLGLLGSQATNALSALQRACLDKDASVRNAATNALIRSKL
jgi:hypothetical protein